MTLRFEKTRGLRITPTRCLDHVAMFAIATVLTAALALGECPDGSYQVGGTCKQYGGKCDDGTLAAQSDRRMENHCGSCNTDYTLTYDGDASSEGYCLGLSPLMEAIVFGANTSSATYNARWTILGLPEAIVHEHTSTHNTEKRRAECANWCTTPAEECNLTPRIGGFVVWVDSNGTHDVAACHCTLGSIHECHVAANGAGTGDRRGRSETSPVGSFTRYYLAPPACKAATETSTPYYGVNWTKHGEGNTFDDNECRNVGSSTKPTNEVDCRQWCDQKEDCDAVNFNGVTCYVRQCCNISNHKAKDNNHEGYTGHSRVFTELPKDDLPAYRVEITCEIDSTKVTRIARGDGMTTLHTNPDPWGVFKFKRGDIRQGVTFSVQGDYDRFDVYREDAKVLGVMTTPASDENSWRLSQGTWKEDVEIWHGRHQRGLAIYSGSCYRNDVAVGKGLRFGVVPDDPNDDDALRSPRGKVCGLMAFPDTIVEDLERGLLCLEPTEEPRESSGVNVGGSTTTTTTTTPPVSNGSIPFRCALRAELDYADQCGRHSTEADCTGQPRAVDGGVFVDTDAPLYSFGNEQPCSWARHRWLGTYPTNASHGKCLVNAKPFVNTTGCPDKDRDRIQKGAKAAFESVVNEAHANFIKLSQTMNPGNEDLDDARDTLTMVCGTFASAYGSDYCARFEPSDEGDNQALVIAAAVGGVAGAAFLVYMIAQLRHTQSAAEGLRAPMNLVTENSK